MFVAKTDWRCTTKPGKLYLTIFRWPAGSFELTKVNSKVKKAYLLASSGHKSVKLRQQGDHVTISLPDKAPGTMASVVVLETAAN